MPVTNRSLVEILGWVLGRDDANLKDQIIAGGTNPSDGPPLEESPNPNAGKAGDVTVDNLAGDFGGVGGQVVVGRKHEFAGVSKINGEFARGMVDGVVDDIGRKKTDWKSVPAEFSVNNREIGIQRFRRRVRV